MAAEKTVKLANLKVEMFQMGLSFQEVLPCTPPGGLQHPLDTSYKVHLLRSLKSLDRRNLTDENFQNLEGLHS